MRSVMNTLTILVLSCLVLVVVNGHFGRGYQGHEGSDGRQEGKEGEEGTPSPTPPSGGGSSHDFCHCKGSRFHGPPRFAKYFQHHYNCKCFGHKPTEPSTFGTTEQPLITQNETA